MKGGERNMAITIQNWLKLEIRAETKFRHARGNSLTNNNHKKFLLVYGKDAISKQKMKLDYRARQMAVRS